MNTYTNIFGGTAVSPANPSYAFYHVTADLFLVWPFESLDGQDVAANIVEIQADASSYKVWLPDGSLVSVGESIVFANVGINLFTVVDNNGNTVIVVQPGQQWLVYLVDNTTIAGQWHTVLLGTSSSAANAASLAGAGLVANITKLDQNLVTVSLTGDVTINSGDRAKVLHNTGGAVEWTLPAAGPPDFPNGWFVYVINSGSGGLKINPTVSTIDASGDKTLGPGESAAVFSDGTNYWTLGYGRAIQNTVTGRNIDISGAGTYTLSSAEVAAQVQDYSGAQSGDRTILYGTGVGYWFVWNRTTGTGETRFKTIAGETGVTVPRGNFSILRSNGANMEVAFSDAGGTVTNIQTTADLTGGAPPGITTTGTIGLANTAVSPGAYGDPLPTPTYATFTVDAKGRLTAAGEVTLGTAAFLNMTTPLDANTPARIPSEQGGAYPGDIKASIRSAIPGWVLSVGTIGSPASGASNRANLDCHELFLAVWTEIPSAVVYNTGTTTPVTRGATAEADWVANRHIALPDLRGDTIYGRSNMGGTDRANLATGFGAPTTVVGNQGGAQVRQPRVYGTVDVSGGISGSTYGAQSVHFGGNTFDTGGSLGTVGGGPATGSHSHYFEVHVNTSGEALGVTGSFSGAGGIRNDGGNVTDQFGIVAPGAIMNWFLKL